MRLIITHYVDREPAHVSARVVESIPDALRAAGERVAAPVTPAATSVDDHHAVIRGGVDLLDGTSIDWHGDAELTTIRYSVPWQSGNPSQLRRLLAANRFATVLSDRVRAVA